MTDEEFEQMLAGLPQGNQQPSMREPSVSSGFYSPRTKNNY